MSMRPLYKSPAASPKSGTTATPAPAGTAAAATPKPATAAATPTAAAAGGGTTPRSSIPAPNKPPPPPPTGTTGRASGTGTGLGVGAGAAAATPKATVPPSPTSQAPKRPTAAGNSGTFSAAGTASPIVPTTKLTAGLMPISEATPPASIAIGGSTASAVAVTTKPATATNTAAATPTNAAAAKPITSPTPTHARTPSATPTPAAAAATAPAPTRAAPARPSVLVSAPPIAPAPSHAAGTGHSILSPLAPVAATTTSPPAAGVPGLNLQSAMFPKPDAGHSKDSHNAIGRVSMVSIPPDDEHAHGDSPVGTPKGAPGVLAGVNSGTVAAAGGGSPLGGPMSPGGGMGGLLGLSPLSPASNGGAAPVGGYNFGVKVVRQGYLNKQGGARGGRKSWKRRFFVLKEDCLYYYDSQEKMTLLGVMPLQGSRLLDFGGKYQGAGKITEPPTFADRPVCYECKISWTLTNRRHHCRNCGNTFCDKCSSKRIRIPKFSFNTPVRVCDACYVKVSHEIRVDTDLKDVVIEEGDEDGHKFRLPAVKKPHLFALKNSERELWLSGDTGEVRADWIKAITSVQTQAVVPSPVKKRAMMAARPREWEIDFKQIVILNKVGKGAFGEVFRARLWGTDTAVKTMKTEVFESNKKLLEELKKEVKILSQLRHPNVVLYIGAATKPPNVCIVTEWCARGSLFDVLHDHSIQINTKLIIEIAMGIAQGMNYLHSLAARIIHRDLKSHNILVDKNFNVKVADFGLSHVREQRKRAAAAHNTLTGGAAGAEAAAAAEKEHENKKPDRHYGIFGTPEWMAPEVMEGQNYTEKIDIYSFGILLCELITRQMPFHDIYQINTYMDVVDAVLDQGALPTIPKWCDKFLKPLIVNCLSRDPSVRPSFTDIILRLREFTSLDDASLFAHFDLQRLRELSLSTVASVQALAASEVATLVRNGRVTRSSGAEPTPKHKASTTATPGHVPTRSVVMMLGGAAPPPFAAGGGDSKSPKPGTRPVGGALVDPAPAPDLWRLHDEDAAAFLERFAALLTSATPSVQLASCRAIAGILSIGDAAKKAADREQLIGSGVMTPLLSLLSSTSTSIRTEAGALLILLTNDAPPHEQVTMCMGLENERILKFEEIIRADIARSSTLLREMEEQLKRKNELLVNIAKALQQDEKRKSSIGNGSESQPIPVVKPKMGGARKKPTAKPKTAGKFVGLAGAVPKEEKMSPASGVTSEEDNDGPLSDRGGGGGGGGGGFAGIVVGTPKGNDAQRTPEYGASPAPVAAASLLNGPTVAGGVWDNLPIRDRNASVHSVVTMFQEKTGDPKQRDEDRKKMLALNKKIAYHTDKREALLEQFAAYYTFQKHHGYLLRWNNDDACWVISFLVLCDTELRLFDVDEAEPGSDVDMKLTITDDPESPHYIIRTKLDEPDATGVAMVSVTTKVKLGSRNGQPFCFVLEDCGTVWCFACATQSAQLEWDARIKGLPYVEKGKLAAPPTAATGTAAAGTAAGGKEVVTPNLARRSSAQLEKEKYDAAIAARLAAANAPDQKSALAAAAATPASPAAAAGAPAGGKIVDVPPFKYVIPLEESVSKACLQVWPSIVHHGYILLRMDDPTLPPTAAAPPAAAAGAAAAAAAPKPGLKWELRWILLLADRKIVFFHTHKDTPDRPLLTVDAGRGKTKPSLTFVPLTNAPSACFTIETEEGGRSVCREFCVRDHKERDQWFEGMIGTPVVNTRAIPSTLQPLTLERRRSTTAKLTINMCAPFMSHWGHVDHYGYLYRKRKYSNRWAKEFFCLVDAEIHYYDSHKSSPDDPSGTVYICTNSGKPFLIQASDKRSHCFTITNPNRTFHMAAENEPELKQWMDAIQKYVKKIAEIRKYEQSEEAAAALVTAAKKSSAGNQLAAQQAAAATATTTAASTTAASTANAAAKK